MLLDSDIEYFEKTFRAMRVRQDQLFENGEDGVGQLISQATMNLNEAIKLAKRRHRLQSHLKR
jgi:hypothetical protein